MKSRYVLPNTFTAGNLLCGFLAILSATDRQFMTAAWLIILAAAFDALDGRVARSMRAYSHFGVEADSLADVVSFGVAPSVLAYRVGLFKMGHAGLLLSFLPLLFASVRLARFNVQLRDLTSKKSFRGLPAPAAALAIATFVVAYSGNSVLSRPNVLAVVCALVSLLMVTNFSYEALPRLSLHARWHDLFGIGYLAVWVILSLLWPRLFIFPLWMVYVLSGPVTHAMLVLSREKVADGATDVGTEADIRPEAERR